MKKIIIFILTECLAYDRTADATCHGAFLSLDRAREKMLKKIEERFDHIKDDYCEDENEWKQWVKERFWKRPEDDDHTVAWSDDDGDTVSKFFIDKVEVSPEEKQEQENDDLLEKIENQLNEHIYDCNIEQAVELIEATIGHLDFVDSKIDDGCDDNEDGDKYVMMNSYDLRAEGRNFYLRIYYGDRSRTVASYEIWAV